MLHFSMVLEAGGKKASHKALGRRLRSTFPGDPCPPQHCTNWYQCLVLPRQSTNFCEWKSDPHKKNSSPVLKIATLTGHLYLTRNNTGLNLDKARPSPLLKAPESLPCRTTGKKKNTTEHGHAVSTGVRQMVIDNDLA